jgi:hypothetical protein
MLGTLILPRSIGIVARGDLTRCLAWYFVYLREMTIFSGMIFAIACGPRDLDAMLR